MVSFISVNSWRAHGGLARKVFDVNGNSRDQFTVSSIHVIKLNLNATDILQQMKKTEIAAEVGVLTAQPHSFDAEIGVLGAEHLAARAPIHTRQASL